MSARRFFEACSYLALIPFIPCVNLLISLAILVIDPVDTFPAVFVDVVSSLCCTVEVEADAELEVCIFEVVFLQVSKKV